MLRSMFSQGDPVTDASMFSTEVPHGFASDRSDTEPQAQQCAAHRCAAPAQMTSGGAYGIRPTPANQRNFR